VDRVRSPRRFRLLQARHFTVSKHVDRVRSPRRFRLLQARHFTVSKHVDRGNC